MAATPGLRRIHGALLAMLALCAPSIAGAAQRTFVSTMGTDASVSCALTAPCRGFTKALTLTDPGGEIVVLDSGGYGPVTINKSVSVTSPAGAYAGISVFAATDGVVVVAPATKVVLRGLTINGQGGNNGVRVRAGEVHVENVVIANLLQAGILVEGGSMVRISGTVARSNADGLRVVPGSGTVSVLVRDSEFSTNGIAGVGVSPSAAGASAQVTVERSSVTKNGAGLVAAPTGSASATLVITQSVASENAGAGVSSAGAGATVFVRDSAITRNNVGLQQANSGLLNACGANFLVANATAQSGAIVTASCLDVAAASGTVTSVATGSGLTGGPITASGTINLAATQLMPTVACTNGQIPQWNGNAWMCAAASGTGTVTNVATGSGLAGGPITGAGTVSIANGGVTAAMLASNGCASGQVLKWNGSAWTCSAAATGTVTSVATGAGLTGGPISTTGTVSVAAGGISATELASNAVTTVKLLDAAVTAAKLNSMGCANTQILKYNGTAWVCAADNDTNSGGTVTQVNTGSGLTGGPITANGTISLAATQLLPAVACAGGQVPIWTGSAWACDDPNTFAGNITLPESTSASVGNIMKGSTPNPFLHNYGSANTFVGESAGNFAMSGSNNTASGNSALHSIGSGLQNTANGSSALFSNTSGSANTAIGANGLYSNTSGGFNTASGSDALHSNTLGNENTAVGYSALYSNTTGAFNTASGNSALHFNTTGSSNTASGYLALNNNSTGGNNIGIGNQAGQNLTTGSFNIDIGNAGLAAEGNTIRIGNANQSRTFIAGIRGVTTGNADAVAVVIDSAGQLGTVSSSRRTKDDIADMGDASSLLMQLRPVTFHYRAHSAGTAPLLQYGLIAEEVADVAPDLVAHTAGGQVETVYYQFLAPMLINEYQKQQRVIGAQNREITELRQQTAKLDLDRSWQSARIAELEHAREQSAANAERQAAAIADLRRAVDVLLARTSPEGRVVAARGN